MYANQRIVAALEDIAASLRELVKAQKVEGGTVITPKEVKDFAQKQRDAADRLRDVANPQ